MAQNVIARNVNDKFENLRVSPCPHENLRSEKDRCPWIETVAPVEDPSNNIDRETSLIMFDLVGQTLGSLQSQVRHSSTTSHSRSEFPMLHPHGALAEIRYPGVCPYAKGGSAFDCPWDEVLVDVDAKLESFAEKDALEYSMGALVIIVNLIIALIEALTKLLDAIARVIEEARKAREGTVEQPS